MWKKLSIYTYNFTQWEELPKRRGRKKKNTSAGRSISTDIVRLLKMKTPWDQRSIPHMMRGTQFKQGVIQSKKRQVQTFLIVHTSSI